MKRGVLDKKNPALSGARLGACSNAVALFAAFAASLRLFLVAVHELSDLGIELVSLIEKLPKFVSVHIFSIAHRRAWS